MSISKREQIERLEMAPALKQLMDTIVNTPTNQLVPVLALNMRWERPEGDLLQWVPVLNRFDEVLEAITTRYGLDETYPRLQVFSPEDEAVASAVLQYTFLILDHCLDRQLYNSGERIYALLQTPTVLVRLYATQVAVLLGERYARTSHAKFAAPKPARHTVLDLCLSYPPQLPSKYAQQVTKMPNSDAQPTILNDTYAYIDTLNPAKNYPKEWKRLHYEYYYEAENDDSTKTTSKKPREGLTQFTLSEQEVHQLSYQQILDRALEAVPPAHWPTVLLAAATAKAFNLNLYEALDLRAQLLATKAYGVAFLTNACLNQFVASKLFEAEVLIFKFFTDLVAPENRAPPLVSLLAMKAFQCISGKRMWALDLVRSMGGSVSHGVLFEIIRWFHHNVVNNLEYCEEMAVLFFNVVGNLIRTKASVLRLALGGLLAELMGFLRLCTQEVTHHHRTVLAAIYLLVLFLESCPDELDEFVNQHGFGLLIDAVSFQTQYALDHPQGPPTDAVVTYTLGFRQAELLEMLFGLARQLIQLDIGDRLRNLFDLPLLNNFNQVLRHPKIFGASLVATTIDLVYYIIHNEPTAYSILNEAGVIEAIVANYGDLFMPDEEVVSALTNIFLAICLNKEGLKMVVDRNLVGVYFEQFMRLDVAAAVLRELASHAVVLLGCAFDELGRHHPELKPEIVKQVAKLVEKLPKFVDERLQGIEYCASDEGEVHSWSNTPWTYVLDFALSFLGGTMEGTGWALELRAAIPFENWLNFLTIRHVPYDFCRLEGVLTWMGFLKSLDEGDRNYALPHIISEISRRLQLDTLQRFLTWNLKSDLFFNSLAPEEATVHLQDIMTVANLLFAILENFIHPSIAGFERVAQVAAIFDYEYPNLIGLMGQFFLRVVLEETLWRQLLSPSDMENLTPASDLATYPMLVWVLAPGCDPLNQKPADLTNKSAVFKNPLQIRHLMVLVALLIAPIFSGLTLLPMMRRNDFKHADTRRSTVAVTIKLAHALCGLFIDPTEFTDPQMYYGYTLYASNMLFECVYHKTRVELNVQPLIMLALAEANAMKYVCDHLQYLWQGLLVQDDAPLARAAASQRGYATAEPALLVVHALHQLLLFVTRTLLELTWASLPVPRFYYPSLGRDDEWLPVEAAAWAVRDAGLCALERMLAAVNEANADRVAPEVARWVVDMASHCYDGSHDKSEPPKLIPLFCADNVSPPPDQYAYLERFGLERDAILQFYALGHDLYHYNPVNWPEVPTPQSPDQWRAVREDFEQNKPRFAPIVVEYNRDEMQHRLKQWSLKFFDFVAQFVTLFDGVTDKIVEWCATCTPDCGIVLAEKYLFTQVGTPRQRARILCVVCGLLVKGGETQESAEKLFQSLMEELYLVLNNQETSATLIPEADSPLVPLLKLLERALVWNRIPELAMQQKLLADLTKLTYLKMSRDDERRLVQPMLHLKDFASVAQALAVCRVALVYALDPAHRGDIAKLTLLGEVMKVVSQTTSQPLKTDQAEIDELKKLVIILLRTVFELSLVLRHLFALDLPQVLFHGVLRPRRELQTLLLQTLLLVLREPLTYISCISDEVRLEDYSGGSLDPEGKMMVTKTPSEDKPPARAEDGKIPDSEYKSTGVVALILDQLQQACQKQWWITPEGATPKNDDPHDPANLMLNPDFGYVLFLLLSLTELLGSYMDAKRELIQYGGFNAVAFIIDNLVSTGDSLQVEVRRQVVLSLSRLCLLALVLTPVLDSANDPQPKEEDPEMASIRKHAVETTLEIIGATVSSNDNPGGRYRKLADVLEMVAQVLLPKFRESAFPLLNRLATQWDQYYITKAWLDHDIGTHLTKVICSIDLNFPDWPGVVKHALKLLITLSKLKLELAQYLEVPAGEGEAEPDHDNLEDNGSDDEDVDMDDPPNMFRHSTLGMYDDDDELDEDDDSDDFGGELLLSDGEEPPDDDELLGLSDLEDDEEMMAEDLDNEDLEIVEEITLSDNDFDGFEGEVEYEDAEDDDDDEDVDIEVEGDEPGEDGDVISIEDFDELGTLSEPDWDDSEAPLRRRIGETGLDFDDDDDDDAPDELAHYELRLPRSGLNDTPAWADILDSFLGESGVLRTSLRIGQERNVRHPLEMESMLHMLGPRRPSRDADENLYVKLTKERWVDAMKMLYPDFRDAYVFGVIPDILLNIKEPLAEMNQRKLEEQEKQRKEQEEAELARQEQERQRQEQIARERAELPPVEPVMVRIGDREVDIAGTDIDPEFFEALPDDMREEVLTEHIRERRAHALSTGTDTREIDPDFLAALPEPMRRELLQQESMARQFGFNDDEVEDDEDEEDEAGEVTQPEETATPKMQFAPLVDKQGVVLLVRLFFAPMLNNQRDHVHHTLVYLANNRDTRVELMNQLMGVVYEALVVNRLVKNIWRAKVAQAGEAANKLPINALVLTLVVQTVEAIEYLVQQNHALRVYLLGEHDNPYLRPKPLKRPLQPQLSKYAINHLLKFLGTDLVKQEQVVMDMITGVIQMATRVLTKPLGKQLNPQIPTANYRQLIGVLTASDCLNLTFRKAILAMQNMRQLPKTQQVFCTELSAQATSLGKAIIAELDTLTAEVKAHKCGSAGLVMAKFSLPLSDQAKLLRILTALDYMFDDQQENKELTKLYTDLALGKLWRALSDCLEAMELEAESLIHSTALLPLIEALMVVCKHLKVRQLPMREAIKYEELKRIDFSKEPIERLFFTFTDNHKKILNQMVRTNPNLMLGPFGMLVRNPKVLEFDNKKNYFDRKLHTDGDDETKMAFTVRRDQVFLDSFRSLFFKSPSEFKTARLEVTFKGEQGVDAGGVTREWYQVLLRQMFNPNYALFTRVALDATTFHPNRTSGVNPEHLQFFKFIGRVIGKAIFDDCYLDCHFSRAVYKRILGRGLSLKDMELLDLDYYKLLVWMLENDITDIITEDFSVEADDYGEHRIIDLVENGRNIPVTEENKQEYVRKVVEYRLQELVAEQMDNFLMGFHEIIPKDLVLIFDEQELELLISGLPDINVDDWLANTTYNNYLASLIQIQWFWRAVKLFDNEERAKLLQFATGTSKVPLNGFKDLNGALGTCKFSIHRDYGLTDRLPLSHTCFNQIDLPAYETYEKLRGSLLLAMTEGYEGFGLA